MSSQFPCHLLECEGPTCNRAIALQNVSLNLPQIHKAEAKLLGHSSPGSSEVVWRVLSEYTEMLRVPCSTSHKSHTAVPSEDQVVPHTTPFQGEVGPERESTVGTRECYILGTTCGSRKMTPSTTKFDTDPLS